MELKRLLTDDDAVSPVIGVILMVAITVILAAVIATFVLGLGDQVSNTAPQASFSFDWDGESGGNADLTVRHSGGDSIQANNLYIRGDVGPNGGGTIGRTFDSYGGNSFGSTSQVTAGARAEINVDSEAEIDIVWESTTGQDSATLGNWEGPDA